MCSHKNVDSSTPFSQNVTSASKLNKIAFRRIQKDPHMSFRRFLFASPIHKNSLCAGLHFACFFFFRLFLIAWFFENDWKQKELFLIYDYV